MSFVETCSNCGGRLTVPVKVISRKGFEMRNLLFPILGLTIAAVSIAFPQVPGILLLVVGAAAGHAIIYKKANSLKCEKCNKFFPVT